MVDIKKRVEMRSVEELKEHPQNEYYHSPLNENEYAALRNSIEEIGVQDPLYVTEDGVIIAGHHRLKVSKEIGLEKVPTRLVVGPEEELIDIALSSNNARRKQEKDVMKLARQVLHYQKMYGIEHGNNRTSQGDKSYKDVADKIGKSVATANRLIRLNYLIPDLQNLVSDGQIPLMAAVELSKLESDQQMEAYQKLKTDGDDKAKRQKKKDIDKLLNGDHQEIFEKQIKKMKSNIEKWQVDLTNYSELDFGRSPKIESVLKTLQTLTKQIEKMWGMSNG
jgi:ParB family transcriptional regulator, chromosome partitioning protein